MKKFIIGFAVGLGLMYWYLEHGERTYAAFETWTQRSASGYRGDRMHEAARDVLGEKKDK